MVNNDGGFEKEKKWTILFALNYTQLKTLPTYLSICGTANKWLQSFDQGFKLHLCLVTFKIWVFFMIPFNMIFIHIYIFMYMRLTEIFGIYLILSDEQLTKLCQKYLFYVYLDVPRCACSFSEYHIKYILWFALIVNNLKQESLHVFKHTYTCTRFKVTCYSHVVHVCV